LDRKAAPERRKPNMKRLIRGFDCFLRWALGVFEFCRAPDCLLRVRRMSLTHPVTLAGETFGAGTPAIELHLWNEHLPPLPAEGPTLAWAVQTQRRLKQSFRALAAQMPRDPRLADARLIGGVTVLPLAGAHAGGVKLFEQLGFTICPYHTPPGPVRRVLGKPLHLGGHVGVQFADPGRPRAVAPAPQRDLDDDG